MTASPVADGHRIALQLGDAMPERVIFVCFDEATLAAYRAALGAAAG